ncbi:hypothetical protein E2C01_022286 [Portunus trituberculatus]|uniref:Uncharacterized protein n=1 Tax=Portunus trituberculatus TaxID=210409 RepID=A0A5B7E6M7_PORTR|nr:hypothetical protein [Portunus trituberculatus]
MNLYIHCVSRYLPEPQEQPRVVSHTPEQRSIMHALCTHLHPSPRAALPDQQTVTLRQPEVGVSKQMVGCGSGCVCHLNAVENNPGLPSEVPKRRASVRLTCRHLTTSCAAPLTVAGDKERPSGGHHSACASKNSSTTLPLARPHTSLVSCNA